MGILAGIIFAIGAVLVLFGLVMSLDGIEARRRRTQTAELPTQRTERVVDEIMVRRRVTKERII